MSTNPLRLAVIGNPIAHSLSPCMHTAMLAALGLEGTYDAVRVTADGLPAWVASPACRTLAGFNATMPHKQMLLDLVDELDPQAQAIGAVNTVAIRGGRLYGYNTDGAGFVAALREQGIDPAGRRVAVLGAGGAVRSLVAALLAAGVAGITLFSRRPEQGAELAAAFPGVQARPLDWSRLADDLAGHNMLVNGTSLGMHGMSQDFADTAFLAALPATGVVCDVVYRPQRTTLLAGAEALDLATVGGAGMLIHQGVLALEHFLNRDLDRAAMARVVWQALRPRLED